MNKYNTELKKKVVADYLAGKGGYGFLARKHGIKNKTQVKDWVASYKQLGAKGLQPRTKPASYSTRFKLSAVECYLTSQASYREVARQLGLCSPGLLIAWQKKYFEREASGEMKPKERLLMSKKSPKKPSKKSETPSETEQLQALKKQIRLLEIENSYLKELRRQGLTDPRFLAKESPKSSLSSENSTD